MDVIDGEDHLSSVDPLEEEALAIFGRGGPPPSSLRLACQARPIGEVVVRKHGVLPTSQEES